MRKLLVLVFIFSSVFLRPDTSYSDDLILKWVNKDLSQTTQVDEVWNPGLLPFDETQLRIELDDQGKASEYSMRYSLKPLFGLRNEFKLSDQRKKILELEKLNSKQLIILEGYRDLLLYWKTSRAVKVLAQSESLYQSAQLSLQSLKSNQNIDFDITSFLTSLANFSSSKTELTTKKEQLRKIFIGVGIHNESLLTQIENIKLLNSEKLVDKINVLISSTPTSDEQIEKIKLKSFEFEKKNREAKQLFKFFSMSQNADPKNVNDYKFQIALRVPFLSDSQELERSKVDYLQSKQKLEMEKIKINRDTLSHISELKGLIEKESILKHLPESSHNKKKLTSTLLTVSEAIKSENQFIQAKLELIETQYLIFEKYLILLSLNNQLNSTAVNHLTAL